MRYDYYDLEALPTLCQGQAADLKVDTGAVRIWLSRCGIEDGELDTVQVERLVNGRWKDVTASELSRYYHGIPRSGVRTDGGWFRRGRDGVARFES